MNQLVEPRVRGLVAEHLGVDGAELTADISLVDDVPRVLEVVCALRPNFVIARAWMAEEFERVNDAAIRKAFADVLAGVAVIHEPHLDFKKRVPEETERVELQCEHEFLHTRSSPLTGYLPL